MHHLHRGQCAGRSERFCETDRQTDRQGGWERDPNRGGKKESSEGETERKLEERRVKERRRREKEI